MSEDEPKSAIELAMEKLRARGGFEDSLTREQKEEIGEIRTLYKAKIAELEIKEEAKMRQAASVEELEGLKSSLAAEKDRLTQEMESKVQRVRAERK